MYRFIHEYIFALSKQTKMKKILILSIFVVACTATFAQNATSTGQQTVQLALSNALDISFTANGTATGSTVSMAFTSANDYANGVESAAQELKIRSNKNFKVSVKSDLTNFAYSGSGNLYTAVVPSNIFELKVTGNSTGGSVATPFSTTGYSSLTTSDQDLILNGTNGDDKRFSIKYKSTPGFGMPAGTYSFDVVYTATQQ